MRVFVWFPCVRACVSAWLGFSINENARPLFFLAPSVAAWGKSDRLLTFALIPMAFSKSFFPLLVMLLLACSVQGQLLPNFYHSTCPRLQRIVRSATKQAINKDPRMGAAVLRIFFH
ncbi:hypothetical protein GW17_00017393, partial [Ensete ventricosum]